MSGRVEYLLDTNVLSETRRKKADERVMAFLAGSDASALYISVLTLGELRKGVALKKRTDPVNAMKLAASVNHRLQSTAFADRILGIDAATARLWGEWSAERPRPVIDTLLAATAHARDLTLVTRNIGDVRVFPAKVLDPWGA